MTESLDKKTFLMAATQHGMEDQLKELLREAWRGGSLRGGFDAIDYMAWRQPPTFDEWFAASFGVTD